MEDTCCITKNWEMYWIVFLVVRLLRWEMCVETLRYKKYQIQTHNFSCSTSSGFRILCARYLGFHPRLLSLNPFGIRRRWDCNTSSHDSSILSFLNSSPPQLLIFFHSQLSQLLHIKLISPITFLTPPKFDSLVIDSLPYQQPTWNQG